MSTREFYVERFKAEHPMFLKTFRALPADKLDYTPHERSNSAGDIAWLLTREMQVLLPMFERGEAPWTNTPRAQSLDEIIRDYEAAAAAVMQRIESLDEETWNRDAQFLVNGNPVMTMPLRDMAWFFLFDSIHHRGQLTTYIRPMGGKVPAIYGPSADER
jgi:uncharacterized damage-inducible protein DinB